MKRIIVSVIGLALFSGCGADLSPKKHKKSSRSVDNEDRVYLHASYEGPDETKFFYEMCAKDEKNADEKYLIEMVSKSVDEYDLKRVDCNLVSTKLSEVKDLMFLRLLDEEKLDFSILSSLENVKEYHLFDTDFSKTKNINSLKHVEIFSFASTGSRKEIDFSVLNNAPALEKVYFSPMIHRNIKDLNPLKDNTQIETFELWREDSEYFKPKLTKETCPIDAKSKALGEFCEKYVN